MELFVASQENERVPHDSWWSSEGGVSVKEGGEASQNEKHSGEQEVWWK